MISVQRDSGDGDGGNKYRDGLETPKQLAEILVASQGPVDGDEFHESDWHGDDTQEKI